MGEATHGSREFFQMKHRMLEFLAEKMGFTVFAIEANWPESLAVNDFVLNGEGDPAVALAGMYFWTWNTEEVLGKHFSFNRASIFLMIRSSPSRHWRPPRLCPRPAMANHSNPIQYPALVNTEEQQWQI
jgi:hypothetical protein